MLQFQASILRVSCAILSVAVVIGCGGGGGGRNTALRDGLPNLRAEPASNFSIDDVNIVSPGDGATVLGTERRLKLASRISNYGPGPLELFGQIDQAGQSETVPAFQVIYRGLKDLEFVKAGDFEFHSEPGHNHWHWENLVSFYLAEAVDENDPYHPDNTIVGSTPKVSFCVVDSSKIQDFKGSGQPATGFYLSCSGNTQGISVGWMDHYTANTPGNHIVIDGVPDGIYWVILEADPQDFLREEDETDNRSAVKIQITGNTVTVL